MGFCFARTLTWQLLAIALLLMFLCTTYYMNFRCSIRMSLAADPKISEDLMSFFPSDSGMTYRAYQFNVQLSNRMPLNREIPDSRPTECRAMYSANRRDLPTVSVIIPFHNEAWSVLLRGLHSILNRSSSTLLKEIILVDDKSNFDFLQEPLDIYLKYLGDNRVKVIRKSTREGLVISRMDGARLATGDVLVFLDAHVEVNVNWLEPLLEAIKKDRRRIAVPVIDNIRPSDLKYGKWGNFTQGGFKWTLDFQWKKVHQDIYTSSRKETDPFPTGTIIGCAMAVDREYFFQMGAYDEAMHIWGGENIEISFKTWMCGGSIYAYPCSRVGHIFRKYLPYSFPSRFGENRVIQKNLQRVADIWMDDYKKYYFASIPKIIAPTEAENRSLQARKALRKKLDCKDFMWYVKNIIPDMPLPKENPRFYGQVMNAEDDYCLTQRINSIKFNDYLFNTASCNPFFANNTFSLTSDHRMILQNNLCLSYRKSMGNSSLDLAVCSEIPGTWTFNTSETTYVRSILGIGIRPMPLGQLIYTENKSIKLCLSLKKRHVDLLPCNIKDTRQFWYFAYAFYYKSQKQMAPLGVSDPWQVNSKKFDHQKR